MLDVLQKAQSAALQHNWSLVNQYLHQLLLNKEEETPKENLSPYLEELLNLALNVLEYGDFQERWEVAKVFSKLGANASNPLIEILADEKAELEWRWFACRILGQFNSTATVRALVEVLAENHEEELVEMAAAALANLGASAVDSLTGLLVESETRLLAVRSLAQIRRSETITPLLSVVQDPQVSVRVAAIEALGSFHDSRIPPVLMEALNDVAAPVRKEAVTALGVRIDLREELDLVNRLKPLLFDFSLEVCSEAASALARLGTSDATDALFQVLSSPATPLPLQVEVVRALGWVGSADALEYLRQALNSTTVEVCQEIVAVLGRLESPDLKPKAAEIIVEFLNSGRPEAENGGVRQALVMALGQLRDTGAIHPLIQLLADSDTIRLHAIAALKIIAPADAYSQLEQLAEDENLTPELKQGVAIALIEW